ncbi:Gfo/Idh/MocA family protein [Actinomadura opuntiae]|uniref:Gfo/Idh/MocA family protein n=1 Tax=Actinomadura sp. OS1-43 TaxID=604315 RepID=UPI00255B20F7|nr:Gfo/Idh/MocA family oxidoreductase [Actinomadura sp. OS1-43]MDL4813071.1 Gfo/Idh/MocA family oxidoreductase [Actinomadura sp. OS1-43]
MNDTKPWRVGIVGAGRIVRTGHLPAYIQGRVPVTAICSQTGTTATRLAQQFRTEFPDLRVHGSARELAADPDVDLIDIATRPDGRVNLIRELLPYGKPLLVQKPIAYTLDEGNTIAREAADAGVEIAVNHNLRWAPAQRQLLNWIRAGELGNLTHLAHVHHFNEDIDTWYTRHPGYLFLDHGLHYLDLARQIAGTEPVAVSARASRLPGQTAQSPLSYSIMLAFDGPLVASLTLHNQTRTPHGWSSSWYVNGDKGDAAATYATATLHTTTGSITHAPSGEWVPDGVLGAYTAFTEALDDATAPGHDLADHLRTLALASAALASANDQGAWKKIPPVYGGSGR